MTTVSPGPALVMALLIAVASLIPSLGMAPKLATSMVAARICDTNAADARRMTRVRISASSVPGASLGANVEEIRCGNIIRLSGHRNANMALIVQKFGGTSVADAERIHRAASRAVRAKEAGNQVCVVVSAMGHTTDELIELAQ